MTWMGCCIVVLARFCDVSLFVINEASGEVELLVLMVRGVAVGWAGMVFDAWVEQLGSNAGEMVRVVKGVWGFEEGEAP